jgi:mannose-6-phosphate isomerase-like protein (cupin superfamily)
LLNSNAKISIGDEVFEVQKEDVVFITAEVSQRYTNFGEERFEFLYYMVPNKPDAIAILE